MALPIDYIPYGACVPFEDAIDAGVLALRDDVRMQLKSFTEALADSCNIMGAIDKMLAAGAAEAKAAMKVVGDTIASVINALEDFFKGGITDTAITAVMDAVTSILSAAKNAMQAFIDVIDLLTDMLMEAAGAAKNIICDISVGAIESLPAAAVVGIVGLAAAKKINKPGRGNMVFDSPDKMLKDLTNDVLKDSGYDSAMASIKAMESSVLKEVDKVNALMKQICGGRDVKLIDKKKLVSETGVSETINNSIDFGMFYNVDFVSDQLKFYAFSSGPKYETTYAWKFQWAGQKPLETTSNGLNDPVPFKYSFMTADKLPMTVTVTAKQKVNNKIFTKTITKKFEDL